MADSTSTPLSNQNLTGNSAADTAINSGIAAGNDQGLASTQLGAANSDQQAALSTLQGIQQVIANMLPPQLEQYAQPLAQLAYTGQYSVTDITAAVQQASALNGIQLDPAAMAAQTQALQQYQQIAEGSGFTPIERAGIAQTMNQIQTQNTGANASIVQQTQQQGQGGVVNNMAARLISQQGTNQNASLAGAQIAGAGQQRAISAIGGEQQTGQAIAGQEVGQQNIEGQAQNTINQYNAGLKMQASQTNQGAQNVAAGQQQNLNTQLEQQNVQNQLAGQQQQINAGATTYAGELGQTGQEEQNAQSQAGVNQAFGLPQEAGGILAQQAGTAATSSGEGAGVTSLYNSLTGSGSGSSSSSGGGLSSLFGGSGSSGTSTIGNGVAYDAAVDDATGGPIDGPGTSTSDSIPARLSKGEYVVKADATSKYEPVIKAINEEASPDQVRSILDRIAPPKKRRPASAVEALAEPEEA